MPPVEKVQPAGKDAPLIFVGETLMKLTKKELDELFIYDETSGTCLRWRDGNEYGATGTHDKFGNPFLFIYGQRVSIALIVWVLHGRILHPQKALAPRDGNLANVRIGNLHEVVLYQTPL